MKGDKKGKMRFYSPLRYPGGKGKISKYFKDLLQTNNLRESIYVEPYAGGASVALSLLIDGYVSRIIINDIDLSIYAFWHSVLNQPDKLCNLIEKTPVNIKTWEDQKEIQKNKVRTGLLELGFSTFFLNRTNRSGIIRAGVIGGKKQQGKWKIDARYNQKDLIERIKLIASHKDRIELHNKDAVVLINELSKKLPKNALFYLDPPYHVKGKDLYLNHYVDKDHKDIAEAIKKLNKQRWVITYDNAPLIRDLYSSYKQVKYFLRYSAAKSKKGEELMIFSRNIYVPMNSPTNLSLLT
jgi:DNA adenine methylase